MDGGIETRSGSYWRLMSCSWRVNREVEFWEVSCIPRTKHWMRRFLLSLRSSVARVSSISLFSISRKEAYFACGCVLERI